MGPVHFRLGRFIGLGRRRERQFRPSRGPPSLSTPRPGLWAECRRDLLRHHNMQAGCPSWSQSSLGDRKGPADPRARGEPGERLGSPGHEVQGGRTQTAARPPSVQAITLSYSPADQTHEPNPRGKPASRLGRPAYPFSRGSSSTGISANLWSLGSTTLPAATSTSAPRSAPSSTVNPMFPPPPGTSLYPQGKPVNTGPVEFYDGSPGPAIRRM